MDVGQGRGNECQYLSVLLTTDPEAWKVVNGQVLMDLKKVDRIRKEVAEWIETHADQRLPSGVTLKENILVSFRGPESPDWKWRRYVRGVQDWRLKQEGDENTLLALCGLTGRTLEVTKVV